MKSNKRHILILIVGIALALGFQNSELEEEVDPVKEEIERRLAEYRLEKDLECYSKSIKRAEEIVDSVLSREYTLPQLDTLEVPQRPNRPPKEAEIELDTSLNVQPLFDTIQ